MCREKQTYASHTHASGKLGLLILNNSLFVELVIGIKFKPRHGSSGTVFENRKLNARICCFLSKMSPGASSIASGISNGVTARDSWNADRYWRAQPWRGQIPPNLPCLLIFQSDSTRLRPQHEAPWQYMWQPLTAKYFDISPFDGISDLLQPFVS